MIPTTRRTNLKSLDVNKVLNPAPDSIVLQGLPMPPSSNGQYSTVITMKAGFRQTRRVKSKEAVIYARSFQHWSIVNSDKIKEAKAAISSWNTGLECTMYFIFPKEKLLTQKNQLKKLDVTNRIKQIHDLLVTALDIDDSWYVRTVEEKVLGVKDQGFVIAVIKPTVLRSLVDLYQDPELEAM
jgi:hypothetical protein